MLSGQNSPTLSSPFLGLQGSPSLSSSQSFQNRSRRVHTSGLIVSGNTQKLVLSNLALLVSDLCHLVRTPWPILITRLMNVQGRRSGCVQATGHSLPLSDVQGWFSLMPQQVNDLQIIPEQNIPHSCSANSMALTVRGWVRKVRRDRVHRSRRRPEAPNGSQTRWGVVVEVKLTRVKFYIIDVRWPPFWKLSAPRVMLLQLPPSSDASSVERGIVK